MSVAAVTVLTGCAGSSKRTSTGPAQAVMCDKCETTWVTTPGSTGVHGQVVSVSKRKVMVCEDCRKEATKLLQSGKSMKAGDVMHKCQSCGGTMTSCEVQ